MHTLILTLSSPTRYGSTSHAINTEDEQALLNTGLQAVVSYTFILPESSLQRIYIPARVFVSLRS
jgi:hypothetical protein